MPVVKFTERTLRDLLTKRGVDGIVQLIKEEDLTDLVAIAQGGFGRVFRGRLKGCKHNVVVKSMSNLSDEQLIYVIKELKMQCRALLHCSSIAKVHGVACVNASFCLVFHEYEGSLASHVESRFPMGMPLIKAMPILLSLARSLRDMHDGAGIVFHDVKPDNVLYDGREGSNDLDASWTDFGLAELCDEDGNVWGCRGGSICYQAPESLVSGGEMCTRSDTWAYGIFMIFVLTGRVPYEDTRAIRQAITGPGAAPPEVPVAVTDPSLRALIASMLQLDPKARPAMADVFQALRRIDKELAFHPGSPIALSAEAQLMMSALKFKGPLARSSLSLDKTRRPYSSSASLASLAV